ncbi:mycofactocin system glycosyltransferase [Nocardia sp. ET3-3]|uniref:Mycofactocin system glycosyltransferase n=1 Tax=Nocardia terrae TaxID=2675851 RepID=A0A7K1V282_9NOCA|nr:mycofactocin biosynthesis glycosyltransferase MftF [Nocardia terrae]MVU80750.1 mycofactocin system glycosyltransferase [Nocardia terrae]
MNTPVPHGFRIALEPGTRQLDGYTLRGGSPARVLRLSRNGRAAWDELRTGPIASTASGILARHLTDAGLAHPRPPASHIPPTVTVIVPVRDRAQELARCLAALDGAYPAVVVDDGSHDPDAISRVAEKYSATLVRRLHCGGPAAARNSGLVSAKTDLIAFLDSDCVADPRWIERLVDHFSDPLVAAVAPRILALPSATTAGRYAATAGSLDMGPHEGRVAPGARVSFVPTAALVVRRDTLSAVGSFDERLRYGEDVDLIWRLHGAGFRIRYEPAVSVRHQEPRTWSALLTRRFHYGTSAGPLALRHPDALAPLVVAPIPAATVAAALAGYPVVAGIGLAATIARAKDTLRETNLSTEEAPEIAVRTCWRTLLGLGRYANQFAWPLLISALVRPCGATPATRTRLRTMAAALVLVEPVTAYVRDRPRLDLVRYTLGRLADDAAYGAGVWAGALRHRTTIPLRPVLARRSGRDTTTSKLHRKDPTHNE